MRLVLNVPALEIVGHMYSSFLPKGKENPQGYWYTKNSLGPLPWIRHWTGMLRPVSSHKWKPPQDRHIMRLPPNVPALETVGRMYSSFFSQGKRKPAGILIYKTSYILVIIPSVATYATHLVTCLFYKNSQCHLDPPPPNLVYNASKFSFLSLQAQMVSKVSWSIIARITKSLRFFLGMGSAKVEEQGIIFLPRVGRGIIGDL